MILTRRLSLGLVAVRGLHRAAGDSVPGAATREEGPGTEGNLHRVQYRQCISRKRYSEAEHQLNLHVTRATDPSAE